MKQTTISQAFCQLTDPRHSRTRRHSLVNILTMAICAIISGCNDFNMIDEFSRAKIDWFKTFLHLPYGTPSHDTFNDVLNRLDPTEFAEAFTQWVTSLAKLDGDIIAVDGKTLRQTADKARGNPAIHLVNAWSVQNNSCFAQVKVSDKSNEITAIPRLLALLNIEGATVTMDAMGCQHKIAQQIVDARADYVIALKGNQEALYEDVKLFLDMEISRAIKRVSCNMHSSVTGDHGRIEQRQVWVTNEVEWLRERHPYWQSIKSIARVEATRELSGKVPTCERRYYISSHDDIDAEFIGHAVRSHWHVENKLHWQLDVSFNEDGSRLRSGHAAENLSLLNKIALNLLKNEKTTKVGIKTKRAKAGWDNDYLLKVLTVGLLSV
jgi:predicted transposase YbfD/YdcC